MTDALDNIVNTLGLISADLHLIQTTVISLDNNSRLPKPNVEAEAELLRRLHKIRQRFSQELSQVRRLVAETLPEFAPNPEFTQKIQKFEALIDSLTERGLR